MLVGTISAVVWFTAFLAAQLAAYRAFGIRHRSKFIMRVFVLAMAGHLATVVWIWVFDGAPQHFRPVLSLACGVLLLMCLFILYMPFFYTLSTSLSVETLSILDSSPGRRLPYSEVTYRFTSEAFVLDRLETMRANGYFTVTDASCFRLTTRGERVARTFDKVKAALALGAGG